MEKMENFDFSKIEDQTKFDALPEEDKDQLVYDAETEAEKIHKEKEKVRKIKETYDYASLVLPKCESQEDKEELERIKEKAIDLLSYIGFEHLTSLPNLQNIYGKGFRVGPPPKTDESEFKHKQYVWSMGGYRRKLGEASSDALCLGIHRKVDMDKGYYKADWENMGAIGFLFDTDGLDGVSISDEPYLERAGINNLKEILLDPRFELWPETDLLRRANVGLLNKAVVAMLVTGNPTALETRKKIRDEDKKSIFDKRVKVNLSYKQTVEVLTNRLTRLFNSRNKIKTEIDLVPVYDILGNMIWPVQMTHEEIIKKLEAKSSETKES